MMKTKNNNKTSLPINNKNINTVIATKTEQYTGPLPPASEFAKYKEVIPDMPERILKVFEEDSAQVRKLKEKALDNEASYDARSQWMAFSIIMLGLIGTLILAYLDKDVASIITGIGTVALIFKGTFSSKQK